MDFLRIQLNAEDNEVLSLCMTSTAESWIDNKLLLFSVIMLKLVWRFTEQKKKLQKEKPSDIGRSFAKSI